MTATPNPNLKQAELRRICMCGRRIVIYLDAETAQPVEQFENPWVHEDTMNSRCPAPLAELIGEDELSAVSDGNDAQVETRVLTATTL